MWVQYGCTIHHYSVKTVKRACTITTFATDKSDTQNSQNYTELQTQNYPEKRLENLVIPKIRHFIGFYFTSFMLCMMAIGQRSMKWSHVWEKQQLFERQQAIIPTVCRCSLLENKLFKAILQHCNCIVKYLDQQYILTDNHNQYSLRFKDSFLSHTDHSKL